MKRRRSDTDQKVAELLRTAKESLQLSVAFLFRLDGTTQHLEVVESSVPFLFQEGNQRRQETSLCQAVLDDGELPAVIPDLRRHPVAMALPAARPRGLGVDLGQGWHFGRPELPGATAAPPTVQVPAARTPVAVPPVPVVAG